MRLDIVEEIWEHHNLPFSDGYFGFLDRNTDKFWERTYLPRDDIKPGVDLYFSPGVFEGRRSNENLTSWKMLWADLDNGYDYLRIDDLKPTLLWETSARNYQAVWFLEQNCPSYAQWASLNKSLTYWLSADKGGWAGSKLLRIPETPNWKYWDRETGMAPIGKMHIDGEKVYKIEDVEDVLYPQVNMGPGSVLTDRRRDKRPEHWMPALNNQEWYDKNFDNQWPSLPMSVKAQLVKAHVTDRSAHIWDTACNMAVMGVHKTQAFHLLMGRPWNKYRDRPQVLWSTITKAYDH